MTATTLTTGLAAYATLVIYARVAGSSHYVGFAVLWAAYYALAGCLAGLQQEVTRASASASDPRPLQVRALALPLAVGLLLGVVACVTAPWWARHLSTGPLLLGCVLLAAVGLAGLVTVHGFLVARRRYGWACSLLLLDAGIRLVAVTAVANAGGNAVAQLVAVLSGSLVWLPCLPWLVRLPGFGWESAGAFAGRAGSAGIADGPRRAARSPAPPRWSPPPRTPGTGVAQRPGLIAALVLFRSPIILLVNGFRPYGPGRRARPPRAAPQPSASGCGGPRGYRGRWRPRRRPRSVTTSSGVLGRLRVSTSQQARPRRSSRAPR